MISLNSFKNFIYINSIIFFISSLEYKYILTSNQLIFVHPFFSILFLFLCRNYFFIKFIQYNLQNKENINKNYLHAEDYKEDYQHEFKFHLLTSTAVETITYIIIKNLLLKNISLISYNDILFFIPKSFFFEIIFDFFHYSTHRILHEYSFLYIHIHKKHHKYSYPMPILTFYHNPLDLIVTNSIPQFLTLVIFPYISPFQFSVILTYKSFVEISGHSSKKLYPSGSFSQFIWLPRLLDISLYTEDHTLHHALNNCNYSKRFSLWDKMFHTYKSPY